MAPKRKSTTGKPLVIVESPAKARTIGKFLGPGYNVEASIGHIRDLPQGAKQIPAKYKGAQWARLGVNVDERFDPIYVIAPGKQEQVKKLRTLLKGASELYLATDEDREGEAISWHLCEVLKPKVPVQRLVFHEITREAIEQALEEPRGIDNDLVRAQEARRIVDRLYGYEVSPLLWRKVRPRLSAGRVQSVAVRMIVERERSRMAFVPAVYWDLLGSFRTDSGEDFQAVLIAAHGRRIPSGKDFEPTTGRLKDSGLLLLDEPAARELAGKLRGVEFRVTRIEQEPYRRKPFPPFTTSTLQQEANRKLGFTARRTMQIAQSLYENGHITYMRTDSTNLAKVAVDAARDLVISEYGREYLPPAARVHATKVKNAQEAHEAIRPAGHPFELPSVLQGQLQSEEYKLFELIWKRTIASQMADAECRRITIAIEANGAVFQVGGTVIDFPGFLRAYVEGSDDPKSELADKDVVLPAVSEGERLSCVDLVPKDHTTQPPPRFTEATLTRKLEEEGIGRPSTYATIIDTIQAREYVFKKGNALVPTWLAFSVIQLLEAHLPSLVDYSFTAQMEDDLDSISRGESGHVEYLQSFYFGDGRPGLKTQLSNKVEEIDARDVSRIPIGQPTTGPRREPIVVRVGRYGPFLEQGNRRASLPGEMPPDELTLERALSLLDQAQQGEQPLGYCPQTGKPVYLKVGRFGPYVQRGDPESGEKPQNASLLKGMSPDQVDLVTALKLLSLPRVLGEHPETGDPVVASNGRFGPFVKAGSETRSLPAHLSPLDVTLQEAMELLSQPKPARKGFVASAAPMRVFEASPVTGQVVELRSGRYGPYVTDGVTNASLPKGMAPEEVTMEQALELLAARASVPRRPKPARRRAPKTPASVRASASKAQAPRRKTARASTAR